MKKVILLSTVIALSAFFSCSENEELEVTNDIPKVLSEYFQSKDYISLKNNFKDFTNNLDSKTFVEFEENNSKVYSLQSRSNGDIFGNIIFSKNDKGVYVSVVELYNRNSNGKIISFDYKNVNNENLSLVGT